MKMLLFKSYLKNINKKKLFKLYHVDKVKQRLLRISYSLKEKQIRGNFWKT